eukprot:CFRG8260T1
MPSLMQLVGLTACLATTGSLAAPTDPSEIVYYSSETTSEVVSVDIEEGELSEIDARASATHSLTSEEWSHLKRVTSTFESEKFDYSASNFGATDEYSVIPGDDDECLVMVGASDSFWEWISNVNIPFETLTSGGKDILRAHQGFVIAAEAIDNGGLTEKIHANCASRSVVTFAGHSRGGGIAQILAILFHERNIFSSVRLVTWGSPRALSDDSANKFHNAFEQVRVVNDNDVVTTQPSQIFGYRHMGTVVCINCSKTGQDADGGFSFNINNHYMDTYDKKIQSITV